MRKHNKEYTEPIFDRLADYRGRLIAHPFLVEARTGQLPTPILHEFAFHQLSDSILWIPMLAQMHDKARSPRLRRAIADNISHAGPARCTPPRTSRSRSRWRAASASPGSTRSRPT